MSDKLRELIELVKRRRSFPHAYAMANALSAMLDPVYSDDVDTCKNCLGRHPCSYHEGWRDGQEAMHKAATSRAEEAIR